MFVPSRYRVVCAVLAVAVVLTAVAGCAAKATPEPTAAPPQPTAETSKEEATAVPAEPTAVPATAVPEKTKITFWSWPDYTSAIDLFMELNPDIEVEFTKMGPWDLHDKLLVSLAAGEGAPDVACLVSRRFSMYSSTGALLDITDRVQGFVDDYPKHTIDLQSWEDRIYGMPQNLSTGVVMYRRDIFEENGVDPESIETWDDFIAAGEKMSGDGRYMLPLFAPAGQWGANNFVLYLQSKGINLFDDQGRAITNNTAGKEMLQWYADLAKEQGIAMEVPFFSPTHYAALKDGSLITWPMNIDGTGTVRGQAPEMEGQWGVMPWPKWSEGGPANSGNWGITSLCIPAQTKEADAAFRLLDFFCHDMTGLKFNWENNAVFPAYLPALDEIKNPDPYYGGQVIADAVTSVTVPSFNYINWAEATVAVGNAIDAVFSGGTSVDDAWAQLESELEIIASN